MSSSALKRIINKDVKEVINQNLKSLGIYIQFDEEDMMKAKAMIVGPKGSLYDNGFLFFNISFPKNYPFSPPDLVYIPRNKVRIHPNLYVGHGTGGYGKVCLSILGTWSGPKWTSIMDITTVLLTIQSLLDKNPLHHEPGQEKNNGEQNKLYNDVIKYETLNTLLLKNYIDPPNGFDIFHDNMKDELNSRKINIKEDIIKLSKENPIRSTIHVPIYRINTTIDYNTLLHNFEKLIL